LTFVTINPDAYFIQLEFIFHAIITLNSRCATGRATRCLLLWRTRPRHQFISERSHSSPRRHDHLPLRSTCNPVLCAGKAPALHRQMMH